MAYLILDCHNQLGCETDIQVHTNYAINFSHSKFLLPLSHARKLYSYKLCDQSNNPLILTIILGQADVLTSHFCQLRLYLVIKIVLVIL